MSFDPLPPDLEARVDRYAADHHVSRDDAVLDLLRAGLEQETSTPEQEQPAVAMVTAPSEVAPWVAEWLKKLPAIQEQKRKMLAEMHRDNPSADQLVGILKDEPEVYQAIQDAIRERRREMYGP